MALFKDYYRTIKNSLGRFISIVLIVAIGAGFYAGLKSAGPNMRQTVEDYYKDYKLMDIKITGNYGLDDNDIESISQADNVKEVSGQFSLDVLTKDDSLNIKVLSIPEETPGINKPLLVSGEFPKNDNECLIDESAFNGKFSIGDEIEVTLKDDSIGKSLKTAKFKIVGTAWSPLYIGSSRGLSTVGNGKIDGFLYINPDVFLSTYYTDVYVTYEPPVSNIDYSASYYSESDNVEEPKREEISSISEEYASYIKHNKSLLEVTLIKQREERQQRLELEVDGRITDTETNLTKAEKDQVTFANNLTTAEQELDKIMQSVEVSKNEIAKKEALVSEQEGYVNNTDFEVLDLENRVVLLTGQINTISNELIQKQTLIEDAGGEAAILYEMNKIHESPGYREEKSALDTKILMLNQDFEATVANKSKIELNKRTILAEINTINSNREEEEQKLASLQKDLADTVSAYDSREDSIKKANDNITEISNNIKTIESSIKEYTTSIDNLVVEKSRLDRVHYILYDRTSNPNYNEIIDNSYRIDAIASIFPIFFVLVAALVCLTGMTRIVEEETMLIGTYKALGYSKSKISGKYVFYALTATVLGSILGLAVGFTVIPNLVVSAYSSMYSIPKVLIHVNLLYTFVIIIVAIAANLLATFFATNKELKLNAAELMRPKAPVSGKRIFLERIGFVWKRLSFKSKITARNIFRYKRRMFMTILGIAGCAALLLTGLALQNSLKDIVAIQYDELFHYDMVVSIDENIKEKERTELEEILNKYDAEKLFTYEKTAYVSSISDSYMYDEAPKVQSSIFVAEEKSNFEDFITLRDRETHTNINLVPDNDVGIVISEKLAELLNVSVGDQINIQDNRSILVTVREITENYTDHFVYMDEYTYTIYYSLPNYTNVMMKSDSMAPDDWDNLNQELNSREYVTSAILAENEKDYYAQMVESLNLIVILLITAAAVLAFVVLYNLTAINIAERKRELSTIKVLGFYNKEVTSYVGRENTILTIIGIIIGLAVGILLATFTIKSAEVETLMFGRSIALWCFIGAGAITFVFALIVNIIMYFQLKKINMLEATKSFE